MERDEPIEIEERVVIHSLNLSVQASVEGVNVETGRVWYEDISLGAVYTLDVLAWPETHPLRVAIVDVVQGALRGLLLPPKKEETGHGMDSSAEPD